MKQSKANKSTEAHDDLIEHAVHWAESLGYIVAEKNLSTKTGADAIFQNHWGEKAILEVVSSSSFKKLFKKPRIREMLVPYVGTYVVLLKEILGLIIVAPRIHNVKKHGIEVDIPEDVFQGENQRVFAVRDKDFKEVIPVLLVKILGSRASATARWG